MSLSFLAIHDAVAASEWNPLSLGLNRETVYTIVSVAAA